MTPRVPPLAGTLRYPGWWRSQDAPRGGCSSAGRAPGCGPGSRGFKSRHSPHGPTLLGRFAASPGGVRHFLRGPSPRAPTVRAPRPGEPWARMAGTSVARTRSLGRPHRASAGAGASGLGLVASRPRRVGFVISSGGRAPGPPRCELLALASAGHEWRGPALPGRGRWGDLIGPRRARVRVAWGRSLRGLAGWGSSFPPEAPAAPGRELPRPGERCATSSGRRAFSCLWGLSRLSRGVARPTSRRSVPGAGRRCS